MSDINQASSASTKTFETSLWLNAAIFGAELLVFTIVYKRFRSVYEPRTFLVPEKKRSEPLPSLILGWPWAVWKADYRDIRNSNGMDAFFFVRYLRMMVKIMLPIWIISWAILLPVTSVNQSNGKTGLDIFTFGNVGPGSQPRLAAHLVLAWVFTFWIWYNIKIEMANFVTTRQQYFVDPSFACTAQANTVLLTGVPLRYLSERAISEVFAHVPGGVKKIWINRDLGELPSLYDRRVKALDKLESAETKLLKLATKAHNKELKVAAKSLGKSNAAPIDLEDGNSGVTGGRVPLTSETLVPEEKRPSHKVTESKIPLSSLFLGKKVDTIEWAREEIAKTTVELERGRKILREEEALSRNHGTSIKGKLGGIFGLMQRVPGVNKHSQSNNIEPTCPDAPEKQKISRSPSPSNEVDGEPQATSSGGEPSNHLVQRADLTYPPLNSAFVLFYNQAAAHMAAQVLLHHEPYRMAERDIGVAPADIIWGNLGLNPYEKKLRQVVSYAATAGLVIGWAIPVAFIGVISNVAALCSTYSWLGWICLLPKTVIGIIQGILPPLLLVVLMMLLPIILRLLARFEGIPRKSGLELSLMTRYFIFQVIHSFLIVTLASGLIAALPELVNNPTSIPTILAKNLPLASNFFLTYVILQGLSGTASGFLQAVPLGIYYAKLFLLGSTPRAVYNIRYTLRNVSWGTLFPATTLLVVVAVTYMVISPIINGLACLTFFLFYELYKYLFLYQFDQPSSQDTGGLFFPKAIQHLFVGLYLQQVCLAALFFLARDSDGNPSAIPEGALMIVLIGMTALFHMIMSNSYGPLLRYLPLSLADKAHLDTPAVTNAGTGGSPNRPIRTSSDLTDGTDPSARKPLPTTPDGAGRNEASNPDKASIDTSRSAGVEKSEHAGLVRTGFDAQPGEEINDFYHPATVEPQTIVWIPEDVLGLSATEVSDCLEKGVDASNVNARMNEKGRVEVDGPPPGQIFG